MHLGVRMGQGCKELLDDKMQDLHCHSVQIDEMWGFIGAKQKTAKANDMGPEFGDVWTWIAIDADTKVIPCFAVGKRDQYHTNTFLDDLASRLHNRPQISTDDLKAFKDEVERAFGD